MRKNLLMLGLLFLLAVSAQAFTLGKLGNFEFKKVYDNVYIMHGPVMNPSVENEGFMNNPALIVGKVGLIVIDPGGNYNVGKKILAEIEKISDKPIVATINTHKHGDHWFANKALLEKYPNLTMYAHPNMIKSVKEGEAQNWYDILERLSKNLKGTDKEFPYPNTTLEGNTILDIDGDKFFIRYYHDGHTDTDLIITHLNSQIMFLGDNLMKNRLGGFDSSSNMMGNIKLLEEIKAEPELRLYVPGHGPSGKRDETIDPFLNYVKIVVEEGGKAYEEDVETYEIKDRVVARLADYVKWDAFDSQMGKHLMKAYSEWEELDVDEEDSDEEATPTIAPVVVAAKPATRKEDAQDIRVYEIDNSDGKFSADIIEKAFVDAGFYISGNNDMNIAFKSKFQKTNHTAYNLFTLYKKDIVLSLVKDYPQVGLISPLSMSIYTATGSKKLSISSLSLDGMARLTGIPANNKDLVKLSSLIEDVFKKAMPGGEFKKLPYKASAKPVGKLVQTFELEMSEQGAEVEDALEDYQTYIEGELETVGFVIAGFNKLGEDFAEAGYDEYDFFDAYSLCKLPVIFEVSKKYPEAGAYAPCTFYMYKKKGDTKVHMAYPSVNNWFGAMAMESKESQKILQDAEDLMIDTVNETLE
jgi:glyoxylase-like metal-dependent hydrolase (beta-lactamase superfamily II)/uncharacterized protein (DUF302 family)